MLPEKNPPQAPLFPAAAPVRAVDSDAVDADDPHGGDEWRFDDITGGFV